MKTWDDFLPNMTGNLPGCPAYVIRDKLRESAMDFLERSRVWKVEQVTLGNTVSGTRVHWVTNNPEDAGLCHLHAVWIGGKEVGIMLPGEAEDAAPGELADPDKVMVELAGRASLLLSPAPRVGGQAIVATVSYAPTEIALGVTDAVYRAHHEAIERRAQAELMAEQGKPWTNLQLAGVHGARYETLLDEAAAAAGPVRRRPMRVRSWG